MWDNRIILYFESQIQQAPARGRRQKCMSEISRHGSLFEASNPTPHRQILGPTSPRNAASCPKYLRRAVMLKSPLDTGVGPEPAAPVTRPSDFPNFGVLDVATIVLCWIEGIEPGILQCIIACTIRRVPAPWRRISCWRILANPTTLSWFPRVAVSRLDGAELQRASSGSLRCARPDWRFGQPADGTACYLVLSGSNTSASAVTAD
jgi:hypothetical protein